VAGSAGPAEFQDKGAGTVADFVEPATGIFVEEAFRHLLSREAIRATRYQDFFSVCLVRPDPLEDEAGENIHQAVSRKIPQFLRTTDVVGRVRDGIGILLLHTEGVDAARVAERIRAHIEQVSFPGNSGSPRQVTLSVGGVSFPRDGYNDTILLSRAQAHVNEAARQGGNRVVHAVAESRG
jgi:diguanylate cyclase (GGDEF)-like protein